MYTKAQYHLTALQPHCARSSDERIECNDHTTLFYTQNHDKNTANDNYMCSLYRSERINEPNRKVKNNTTILCTQIAAKATMRTMQASSLRVKSQHRNRTSNDNANARQTHWANTLTFPYWATRALYTFLTLLLRVCIHLMQILSGCYCCYSQRQTLARLHVCILKSTNYRIAHTHCCPCACSWAAMYLCALAEACYVHIYSLCMCV